MPIYEYECLTCGTTFEKRQSFSDAPAAECPNGHAETRRLLSAPAIVFKGSGFYINDSRGTNKHSTNGGGKVKSSSSSSDSSKSSDSSSSKSTDSSNTKASTD